MDDGNRHLMLSFPLNTKAQADEGEEKEGDLALLCVMKREPTMPK